MNAAGAVVLLRSFSTQLLIEKFMHEPSNFGHFTISAKMWLQEFDPEIHSTPTGVFVFVLFAFHVIHNQGVWRCVIEP